MENPCALLGWNHSTNVKAEDLMESEFDPRWVTSATQFFLKNIGGISVYLESLGEGWAVRVQESYLTRKDDKFSFEHKHDIPSFEFWRIASLNKANLEQKGCYVFESKEAALSAFLIYEHGKQGWRTTV